MHNETFFDYKHMNTNMGQGKTMQNKYRNAIIIYNI